MSPQILGPQAIFTVFSRYIFTFGKVGDGPQPRRIGKDVDHEFAIRGVGFKNGGTDIDPMKRTRGIDLNSRDGFDHEEETGAMIARVGTSILQLVQGDITSEVVDAIVNAANNQLAGGGGVDGAIHRAAGPLLMQQTRERYPVGCRTGDAVVTEAGNLSARFVFHAVGPVWNGGRKAEQELLASVYSRCLELAVENDCQSIAFPAISTGVYRFPVDLAASVSLSGCLKFLSENSQPSLIRFVLFDAGTYAAFARVLESLRL